MEFTSGFAEYVGRQITKEKEMTNKSKTKFSVGDKVVSLDCFCAVRVGEVCTVSELLEYTRFTVVEHPELIMWSKKWELQEPQSKFKNMKFKVKSPEHSKEIQEALFEMGFCWRSHGCEVRFTDSFPPCDYLYTDEEGHLWRIDSGKDYLASSFISAQEYTIETTKSYKLIPVEIPKPETVIIDGKTYDKETVLKRIAALQPVLTELEVV